jgi:DNA ligase 1
VKAFAELFETLDATTSTSIKVAAMQAYFETAPPRDAAWAVYVLSGRRPKRLAGAQELRQWLQQAVAYPAWLIDDAYAAVGDLAETIALLLASPAEAAAPATLEASDTAPQDQAASLADWMEQRLPSLREADAEARRLCVTRWWLSLDPAQAFLVTKLLTGGLRVGVSRLLVARALAEVAGVPRAAMQHRLMGQWQPGAAWFTGLLQADAQAAEASQPYPFFLASPLQHDEDPAATLGARGDWLAEWKWDGMRAQCIRRGGEIFIWSRGEELVTDRYPEVMAALSGLPEGSVLDGELVAWRDGRVLPFAALQRRIGRREPSRRLCEEVPVRLLAYDLLEWQGRDLRAMPLLQRRTQLEAALAAAPEALALSPVLPERDWPSLAGARERSRALGVEGLMLKRLDAGYAAGRVRGAWWKWKIEPLTLDAVMIYAQAGHGRRASLHTDYTFAVWQDEELVPVAKAYSGLTDAEITRLDRWIRRHTQQRFGPVRQVEPLQVFELAFEGIARSPRHRAGLALRFPRIQRWREDLGPRDADRLEDVAALLAAHER